MTEGGVRVRERGQEAVVDAPSMDDQIVVDLNQGPDGKARVYVPSGTQVVHDEDLSDEDDLKEAPQTDGGAPVQASLSTRLVGTGIEQEYVGLLAAVGVACALASVASPDVASAGALVGGGLVLLLSARSYFVNKATGGSGQ